MCFLYVQYSEYVLTCVYVSISRQSRLPVRGQSCLGIGSNQDALDWYRYWRGGSAFRLYQRYPSFSQRFRGLVPFFYPMHGSLGNFSFWWVYFAWTDSQQPEFSCTMTRMGKDMDGITTCDGKQYKEHSRNSAVVHRCRGKQSNFYMLTRFLPRPGRHCWQSRLRGVQLWAIQFPSKGFQPREITRTMCSRGCVKIFYKLHGPKPTGEKKPQEKRREEIADTEFREPN